jgi:hypothetical protein
MMHLNFIRLTLGVVLYRMRRVAEKHKPEIKLFTLIIAANISSQYLQSISSSAEYLVCLIALVRKYGRWFM